MFHTDDQPAPGAGVTTVKVVIPWRGFRCFTLINGPIPKGGVADYEVVIPWRGFRCFTPPR